MSYTIDQSTLEYVGSHEAQITTDARFESTLHTWRITGIPDSEDEELELCHDARDTDDDGDGFGGWFVWEGDKHNGSWLKLSDFVDDDPSLLDEVMSYVQEWAAKHQESHLYLSHDCIDDLVAEPCKEQRAEYAQQVEDELNDHEVFAGYAVVVHALNEYKCKGNTPSGEQIDAIDVVLAKINAAWRQVEAESQAHSE